VSVLPFLSQSSRGWGSATALEVKKKVHRKIIGVQKMVVEWVDQRMTAHQMIIEQS
jgi:hypothetical protein